VHKFKGAIFKSFEKYSEAVEFFKEPNKKKNFQK